MPPVDEIIATLRQLHNEGLSERELAYRTGLGKSSMHDVLAGKQGISEKRAATVAEKLAAMPEDFTARAPATSGHMAEVDAANKKERGKLREYLEAVDAFKRGEGSAKLDKIKTEYVWIRTERGKEKFYLNKDKQSLRELARSGELREVKYWRGRGTP